MSELKRTSHQDCSIAWSLGLAAGMRGDLEDPLSDPAFVVWQQASEPPVDGPSFEDMWRKGYKESELSRGDAGHARAKLLQLDAEATALLNQHRGINPRYRQMCLCRLVIQACSRFDVASADRVIWANIDRVVRKLRAYAAGEDGNLVELRPDVTYRDV